MIEVSEPQLWTLIGVFAAALFGMLTLMSTMFLRVLRTEIGSVRTEIGSLRTEMRTEIRRVEDVMATRFEHLGRDVSAISRRVFPDPPAA